MNGAQYHLGFNKVIQKVKSSHVKMPEASRLKRVRSGPAVLQRDIVEDAVVVCFIEYQFEDQVGESGVINL